MLYASAFISAVVSAGAAQRTIWIQIETGVYFAQGVTDETALSTKGSGLLM